MTVPFDNGSVRMARVGPVATITIDRQTHLNALNDQVVQGLSTAADIAAADPDVRALVVTGAGDNFCAGADIGSVSQWNDEATARRGITTVLEGLRAFARIPKPVVAAVEGYAFGGGMELALWCDIRVASEDARLGMPEVKIGLFPGAGGSQLLPRLAGRSVALELMLLGRPITGRRAFDLGLAAEVVPRGQALAAATRMAGALAELAPLALGMIKKTQDAAWYPFDEALKHETRLNAELFATDDRREGMAAFLDKRAPRWQGT
ncbi:enoyl-CoA hydratase/isomerase family protein [Rhodococcus sp. ACPA1]|uniref:enoyl-CoA hydratase/isomerase family protein n=1 Tax=Rhodococcus sp. ACPA1 TaxID=2028572 RepID=UPI0015C98BEC|nr:enoyl-CoA hydratase/isomerase family protein [Rhodococcus sp. ACPA1]